MVLATLLLLCAAPPADKAVKVAAANANAERQTLSAAATDNLSKVAPVAAALPSAPEPKVNPEVEPASFRSAAQPFQPARPVTRRSASLTTANTSSPTYTNPASRPICRQRTKPQDVP